MNDKFTIELDEEFLENNPLETFVNNLSSEIEEMRNNIGQQYTECSKCKIQEKKEQVYISLGGNKYHWSLQCPAVKRTIIEKKKEEIKGTPICHKCGKQNEENTK